MGVIFLSGFRHQMYKVRTKPFLVRGKGFIVDRRESSARDIWMSPEQRESSRLNMTCRLTQALRGGWWRVVEEDR